MSWLLRKSRCSCDGFVPLGFLCALQVYFSPLIAWRSRTTIIKIRTVPQTHKNPSGGRTSSSSVPLFVLATLLNLPAAVHIHAQDPFEIHVYEYESPKPGAFTLEGHLNYVGVGTKTADGPVAPFNSQFHMTYELTGGITDNVSLGFMLLSARRPGYGLDYAGWRLLPHFLCAGRLALAARSRAGG